MKSKIKTTLLIAIFTINALYAIAPTTLFDRDSFVVTSVDYLARRSNIIGIYDNFPATGTKVLYTFNQIDRQQLTDVEKSLYDQVDEELNKKSNFINDDDGFLANIQIPITMEGFYYNTHDGSPLKQYELDDQYKDVAPWFDFRAQLSFGENIFGYAQFAIKDRLNYKLTDLASNFSMNLDSFALVPNNGSNFEIHQPFKIGLSVGDNNYNFQIGRNRLSVGSGITGNFFIGDNFSKQDYTSLSLFSSFINYTISVTEFDQQSSSLNFDSISFNGKHQYRVMNRMRFEILKNLSLDIYQGALFQTDSINFRMVIPFMYVHNYFNFSDSTIISGNDEANNIFGIQAKWVINKGNELNFIATFDQIQIFESAEEIPQAYGILINYKNSSPLKKGMLNNSLEFVYTSPYLYLNEKYNSEEDRDNKNPNYNYDHIYGNSYGDDGADEIGYSGYYYGPDTLMLAYSINYSEIIAYPNNDNIREWNIGADLTLRVHGTKGIKVNSVYEDILGNAESSLMVGIPETILSFMPKGSMDLTDYLSINGSLNFNTIFNHYHDISSPVFFDIQAKIGLIFNFL